MEVTYHFKKLCLILHNKITRFNLRTNIIATPERLPQRLKTDSLDTLFCTKI